MLLEHKLPQLMSQERFLAQDVAMEKTAQVSKAAQTIPQPKEQRNGIVANGNGLMNGHH